MRCVDDNDEVQADGKCDAAATAGGASSDVYSDMLVAVRPRMTLACSVPCDGDEYVSTLCVFSHWTAWSPCSRRCDGVSTRFRFMEGHSA